MCGPNASEIRHRGYGVLDMMLRILLVVGGGSAGTASRIRIPNPEALWRRESRMRMPIYSRAMEYALPLIRRDQPLRKKPKS